MIKLPKNVGVLNSYRTKLPKAPIAKQINELERLSKAHGQFCQFISDTQKNIHCVFNKEKGVSIAELIRENLPENSGNVIYCEGEHRTTNNSRVSVCVVIVNGIVEADLLIEAGNMDSELEFILEKYQDVKFDLILAGKPFLYDKKYFGENQEDGVRIPSNLTVVQMHLDKSVLVSHQQNFKVYELQHFKSALKDAGLRKTSFAFYIIILMMIVSGGLSFYPTEDEEVKTQEVIDIYAPYRANTANLPSAVGVIESVGSSLYELELINGWGYTELNYNRNNNQILIKMFDVGGSYSGLTPSVLSSVENASKRLTTDGKVEIFGVPKVMVRTWPYVIYKMSEIEDVLYTKLVEPFQLDTTSQISLSVSGDLDQSVFKTRTYNFSAKNLRIQEIIRMGAVFVNMPLVVNEFTVKPEGEGYNVQLNFSTFGTNN